MTKKQTEEQITNQKQKSEISKLRSEICDNHQAKGFVKQKSVEHTGGGLSKQKTSSMYKMPSLVGVCG